MTQKAVFGLKEASNETTLDEFDKVEWTPVTTGGKVDDFWKPVEGTTITGRLKGSYRTAMGETFLLETSKGVIGLPSHTVLVNALTRVRMGSPVRVTCQGQEKNSGGQRYMDYLVEAPKENFASADKQ